MLTQNGHHLLRKIVFNFFEAGLTTLGFNVDIAVSIGLLLFFFIFLAAAIWFLGNFFRVFNVNLLIE